MTLVLKKKQDQGVEFGQHKYFILGKVKGKYLITAVLTYADE
jgi:hypothetical protein